MRSSQNVNPKMGLNYTIEENAVRGSDGEDTAKFEIGYFFAGCKLV